MDNWIPDEASATGNGAPPAEPAPLPPPGIGRGRSPGKPRKRKERPDEFQVFAKCMALLRGLELDERTRVVDYINTICARKPAKGGMLIPEVEG